MSAWSDSFSLACDFFFDCFCDQCEQDGRNAEAKGYCSNCEAYLCRRCYASHLTPPARRNHVLLDDTEMPERVGEHRARNICVEACPVHKDMKMTYVCYRHREFICKKCVSQKHRDCRGVDYIPDVAEDTPEEYGGLIKKITDLTTQTQKSIKLSQDNVKLSRRLNTEAHEAMSQFRKDVMDALDRIERFVLAEAERMAAEAEEKMRLVEEKFVSIMQDFRALEARFTNMKEEGQFCQMFMAMKRVPFEIASLESRLADYCKETEVQKYSFVLSSEAHAFLETPEKMVKLENICSKTGHPMNRDDFHRSRDSESYRSSKSTNMVSPTRKPPQPSNLQKEQPVADIAVQSIADTALQIAEHVLDIGVKTELDEEPPDITGSVLMSGGKLVVADFSNKKIKVIDLRYVSITDELKLSAPVLDISRISHNKAAATSYNHNAIYIVNVDDKLTLHNTIYTKRQCIGLAALDDKLLVTNENPVTVEIISMTGQVLKTLISSERGSALLTQPRHVVIDDKQQNVYVSDFARNTVTSLDLNGEVKRVFEDKRLSGPGSLTVSTSGSVYICGCGSESIHCVNADLTKHQVVLQKSDGIAWPQTIAYCDITGTLYIGMGRSDVLKVYKLTKPFDFLWHP